MMNKFSKNLDTNMKQYLIQNNNYKLMVSKVNYLLKNILMSMMSMLTN